MALRFRTSTSGAWVDLPTRCPSQQAYCYSVPVSLGLRVRCVAGLRIALNKARLFWETNVGRSRDLPTFFRTAKSYTWRATALLLWSKGSEAGRWMRHNDGHAVPGSMSRKEAKR